MSLTLFQKYNVNLHLLRFPIAPGWIQNINSITIVIGAPLLALFFVWIRRKTQTTALLRLQYGSGLLLVAFRFTYSSGRDRIQEIRLYGIFFVVYNLCVSSCRGIID